MGSSGCHYYRYQNTHRGSQHSIRTGIATVLDCGLFNAIVIDISCIRADFMRADFIRADFFNTNFDHVVVVHAGSGGALEGLGRSSSLSGTGRYF